MIKLTYNVQGAIMKKVLTLVYISFFLLLSLFVSKGYAFMMEKEGNIQNTNYKKVAVVNCYGNLEVLDDTNNYSIDYIKEYLSEVSKYTGWKYEYLTMTNENAISALKKGEIDLIFGASSEITKDGDICLSDFSVGNCSYMMCILSDLDHKYDDFKSLNNLKIGVLRNSTNYIKNKQYIKNNINYSRILIYDDYSNLSNALNKGTVDAILINEINYIDDYKIIAEFNPYPTYIATYNDSAIANELNEAQGKIYSFNREFNDILYSKYKNRKKYMSSYTYDELKYLSQMDTLNVYLSANKGIFSKHIDRKYFDIQYDLLNCIGDKLGIKLNIITDEDCSTDKLNEILDNKNIDIYVGYFFSSSWAEQNNMYITNPYIYMNYYKIQRKGSLFLNDDEINETIVAIPDSKLTKDYIVKNYSGNKIIWVDNDYECIKLVSEAQADVAYVNTFIAEHYLNSYDFQNLSINFIDYKDCLCYAVPKTKNTILVSILNKTISKLTHDEIRKIVCKNIIEKKPVCFLKSFFIENILLCMIVISAFAAMLVFIIMQCVINKIISRKNRQLLLATTARNEFFSRISHDIRTPMTSIIGLSKLGLKEENEESKKIYFSQIYNSCNYLLGILNDTLDIGKLESKVLKLNVELVQLNEFINSINNIVFIIAKEKNINFSIINENENLIDYYAYFDKIHINQIFVNLITNAIKFTPEGGDVKFIVKKINYKDSSIYNIEFWVVDNGVGISEEFIPHIYESFSQENVGGMINNTGIGLGLTIVKNLVELMNGKIYVDSNKGKGTKFRVIIPTMIVNKLQNNKLPNDDKKNKYDRLAGKKVLLVEDNHLNSIIISKILDNVGIETDICDNGLSAVNKFKYSEFNKYDIIIMDNRMPVMNGLTAIKEIREIKRPDSNKIPIVTMTADVIEENYKNKDLKIDGYIMKPVEPDILYDMIYKLCCK